MGKLTKIALTVVLGLVGIALATRVFGPAGLPFAAEVSKWAPAVLISIFAFAAAQAANDTAGRGEFEARAARQEAELAREDTRVARVHAEQTSADARRARELAEAPPPPKKGLIARLRGRCSR